MSARLIELEEERFRLNIPLSDALAFAMGWADLHYVDPPDTLRQVVGLLVVDALEYSEEWRLAAMVHACLGQRWPDAIG